MTTNDGVATFFATADTTILQRQKPVVMQQRFVPTKIKRDFVDDWIGEIRGAYFSVQGDAPPKRQRAKKAQLVRALRATLKLAESYRPAPPEET